MQGVVIEVMPDSRFLVTLDSGHKLITYSAGRCANTTSYLAGDKVSLELSPYDLSKGRITFRTSGRSAGSRNPRSIAAETVPPACSDYGCAGFAEFDLDLATGGLPVDDQRPPEVK